MPRLWNATIETHRAAVRDATMDAAAALVAEEGLTGVTMSQIAARTGIGRATLYKYFPDVESILTAWHDRQVAHHLAQLTTVHDQTTDPQERLGAVLSAYVHILGHARQHGDDLRLVELLHHDEHLDAAHHQLRQLFHDVLLEAVELGTVRDDTPLDDLVSFCLHALNGAGHMDTAEGADRLVTLTLAGLKPAAPRRTSDSPEEAVPLEVPCRSWTPIDPAD